MHKVFVSYYHANDQAYRDAFERVFATTFSVFISMSVQNLQLVNEPIRRCHVDRSSLPAPLDR